MNLSHLWANGILLNQTKRCDCNQFVDDNRKLGTESRVELPVPPRPFSHPGPSLPIPSPPPPIFSSSPKTAESIHSQLLVLAESLVKDLTQHKLLGRLSTVHGLWKNIMALSVNDDGLREVIHAAWGMYLTAAGWTDGRLHLRKGKLIPGYQ